MKYVLFSILTTQQANTNGNKSRVEVILQADNVLEPSVMLQTSRLLQVAIPHLTDALFFCSQAAEEVLVTNNETSSYLAYIILKEGGLYEIESLKT